MQANDLSLKTSVNIDIRRYLMMCLSYKWRILLVTFLATSFAVFIASQKTPVYESMATLLIESGDVKSGSAADSYSVNTNRNEFYATQFEILKSKEIAEIVIQNMDLMNDPAFFPSTPEKIESDSWIVKLKNIVLGNSLDSRYELDKNFQEKIKMERLLTIFERDLMISPKYGTQLVNISFKSADPIFAAEIANGIGEAYIDKEVNARISTIQKSSDWLSSKLVDLSLSLEASELALQQFREREKMVDIESAVSLINQELSSATELLTIAETNKRRNDAILAVLNTSASIDDIDLSNLPEITSQSSVQAIQSSLQSAQFQLDELSKVYGPKHPRLKSSINEVNSISDRLKKQISNIVNGIKIEAQRATETVNKYKKDVQTIRDKFQIVTGVENEYLSLKRNVDTNRNLYETFFSRSKETAIATDFNFSPARFTGRASPAIYPLKSNKKIIVIAAFVLSMGLCLGIILLFEILNDTVKSSKDVENLLAQRMLGILPHVHLTKQKKSTIRNLLNLSRRLFGMLPEVTTNKIVHLPLHYFFNADGNKFSESVRTLRSNFMLLVLNKKSQVLEVTSSVPGEGKTTVAMNLAFSLQKMGKIILIDGDLRKPSIGNRFKIPAYQPGLSNILAGTEKIEDCIYVDEVSGVSVIPSGQLPNHPLELLSSESFSKFLYLLKRTYTHIIIDTPPIYVANDSLVVGQHVDNVLYVVKSDDTRISMVQNGIKRMIEANAKIAGVILNKVDVDAVGHQAEDYNGYYDYYSYGENIKSKKEVGLKKGEITLLS